MRCLLVLAAILYATALDAQNFLSRRFKDRYFSFSTGTGTASYFGELNYNNSFNIRLSQVNTGIEARLLNRLAARIDAIYFTLRGADSNAPDSSFRHQRNLSFNARNFQVQLTILYYFRRYSGDYHQRWLIDPYIFMGTGYFYYRPTADLAGETFLLRKVKTEGISYKSWSLSVPLGVGIKFKINEFFNVITEISYNFTFTDYLDDVSGQYPTEFSNTTAELLSNRKDEIGIIEPQIYDQLVPGAKRGDPSANDHFLIVSLKMELFIPAQFFAKKNR